MPSKTSATGVRVWIPGEIKKLLELFCSANGLDPKKDIVSAIALLASNGILGKQQEVILPTAIADESEADESIDMDWS